jgi:cytidylate kinase
MWEMLKESSKKRNSKNLVITISGLHGVGKSTIAKSISKEFNLRYISAGLLFRKIAKEKNLSLLELSEKAMLSPEIDAIIDNMQKEEASKGNVIIDGLISSFICKDFANIKIYIKADLETRINRIAKRDGIDFNKALKETLERENNERERFKKFYGFDIDDMSIYNLVIDNSFISASLCIKIIKIYINDYLKSINDKLIK